MDNKFSYEIKDFKPFIRKNPRARVIKIVVAVIAAIALVILGANVYKKVFYREKVAPDVAIHRALEDTFNHTLGKESYLAESLESGEWIDLVLNGKYNLSGNIKLKELGDFSLGFEEMVKGANLGVDADIDKENNLVSGKITAGWTLFSINVMDFYSDDSEVLMTAPELVKETFRIEKNNLSYFDMPISELYERFSGESMENSEYANFSVNDLLKKAEFKVSYKEIDGTKSIRVNGKEVKCYGYAQVFENEAFEEPLVLTYYVNKDYQLISVTLEYSHVDENSVKSGITFQISMNGDKHPSDVINGKLKLYAGNDEINGKFSYVTVNSDDKLESHFDGELIVPGINLSAVIDMAFDKETREYTITSEMTDEVDVLKIDSKGKFTNDTENGEFKIELDKFNVTYSDDFIFNVRAKLAISKEMKKDIEKPEAENGIIDVMNMNQDDIDNIIQQIMDTFDSYKELFKDFM